MFIRGGIGDPDAVGCPEGASAHHRNPVPRRAGKEQDRRQFFITCPFVALPDK
ncbi:MAG: hypothetical protein MZV63_62205 [Marinilabiliales bacterium]|nr:hypothetical protein [Marinilabiliales bacterium]